MKEMNWNDVLSEGEELVWTGKSEKVKLLDGSTRGMTYLLWGIAAVWLLCSLVFFIPKSLAAGDNIVHMIIMLILIDCIPILMLTMPFSDCKWLNQFTEYAVTNRRVLVQGKEKLMSLKLTGSLRTELRKRDGGYGHILLGTAVDKPDARLRSLAIRGLDVKHVVDGLVLYHISEPERVMKLLSDRIR